MPEKNRDRLHKLELIKSDLAPAYAEVVDGLTPDQMDAIESVKKKLDKADEKHLGRKPAAGEQPFTTYLLF